MLQSDAKIRFPICHDRARALSRARPGSETPASRIAQFSQVRSAQSAAHGNEHVRAGLDQHPFIDGYEDLAIRFGLVGQYSPAPAPPHNPIGAVGVRTNLRVSPRRCADTPVLSAKTWNGRRTLRFMSGGDLFRLRFGFCFGFGIGGRLWSCHSRQVGSRVAPWLLVCRAGTPFRFANWPTCRARSPVNL